MALSSKISFLLLFLLTLLSSNHHIHARDSQLFNKIPSNNNVAYQIQPKQEEDPLDKLEQEPNFLPENNQNAAYGLYGQESGQLPPSTITNTNLPYKNNNEVEPNEFLPKYLPKNYNTESYVTVAEGYHPAQAQETNTNNYFQTQNEGHGYQPAQETNTNNYFQSQNKGQGYQAAQETNTNNYYQTKNQNQNQGQGYPATSNGANYYQNYGNNNYNGQQQGVTQYNLGQKSYTTSGAGGDTNYNNAVADKQGMSDTRFLENGKYYYDVNLEKTKTNTNPFGNTRRFGDQYRKYGGYDGNGNNNENSNELNNYSNDGFESKGEQYQDFQEDDEGLP